MSLGTPLAMLLSILFLIPGFIWRKVVQVCSPYAPSGKIELLECFMLSCVNYLVGMIFIYPLLLGWPQGVDINKPATILNHPAYLGCWLSVVFIVPLIGGFVTAKLSRSRKTRPALKKFGMSILHPAPTGWDYAFARHERYWARIDMVNGKTVVGLFGSNSLASGVPGERDVFLEGVIEWDKGNKRYNGVERNAGIWISADQIRTILFFDTGPSYKSGDPPAAVKRVVSGQRANVQPEEQNND